MNTQGTNFVHDLVQMATDAAKVPELEARIQQLEVDYRSKVNTINELEQNLISKVNEHGDTLAKLRHVEGQRDDAELRFLEADDGKLAAVRAMRLIVNEAESLVKALTPPEPEPVRPDYAGKWLTDVQGWQGITLNHWTGHGGASDRFVMYKPVEIPSEAREVPLPSSTASTDSQDHGGGESVSWPEPPKPTQEEKDYAASTLSAVSSEGQSDTNPTAETLIGSIGETVQSQPVIGLENAGQEIEHTDHSMEGNSQDPFAASTEAQSPNVSTGDAETKDSVSQLEDELWAIPSRASHHSG